MFALWVVLAGNTTSSLLTVQEGIFGNMLFKGFAVYVFMFYGLNQTHVLVPECMSPPVVSVFTLTECDTVMNEWELKWN